MSIAKKGLGRGLDALFSNSSMDNYKISDITIIKISDISPNKDQPRKNFDLDLLNDLAKSIEKHGVLQPLLVRIDNNGRYQIIAGERRWRAAKIAGLEEIPVIVKDLNDSELMQIALIENLQREDLNIIEEALGYKYLISNYKMTQEDVAEYIGKPRSTIANVVRLLNLPDRVISMIKDNQISAGHARTLLALENNEVIEKKAMEIIKNGWTVRETEQFIKKYKNPGLNNGSDNSMDTSTDNHLSNDKHSISRSKQLSHFYEDIQKQLNTELNRKVKINYKNLQGSISINFENKQDLLDLIEQLKRVIQ